MRRICFQFERLLWVSKFKSFPIVSQFSPDFCFMDSKFVVIVKRASSGDRPWPFCPSASLTRALAEVWPRMSSIPKLLTPTFFIAEASSLVCSMSVSPSLEIRQTYSQLLIRMWQNVPITLIAANIYVLVLRLNDPVLLAHVLLLEDLGAHGHPITDNDAHDMFVSQKFSPCCQVFLASFSWDVAGDVRLGSQSAVASFSWQLCSPCLRV